MDELNEGPRVGLLGAVALALVAFPASAQGWRMSGLGAPAYDVTTVSPGACAPRAARIRSNGEEAKGPVAVLQSFKAGAYRGSRVRYSAMVDAKALGGWAGLLFHVEGAGDKALLVDDMSNRPVRGTQACTRLAVVLEVPPEAEVLSVGVAVDGPGTLEFGDIALEKVGDEVPVTVGPRVPQGRIGDLTFTETALTGTIAWGRKVQVARQASGEWRD